MSARFLLQMKFVIKKQGLCYISHYCFVLGSIGWYNTSYLAELAPNETEHYKLWAYLSRVLLAMYHDFDECHDIASDIDHDNGISVNWHSVQETIRKAGGIHKFLREMLYNSEWFFNYASEKPEIRLTSLGPGYYFKPPANATDLTFEIKTSNPSNKLYELINFCEFTLHTDKTQFLLFFGSEADRMDPTAAAAFLPECGNVYTTRRITKMSFVMRVHIFVVGKKQKHGGAVGIG